ncbi:MAG: DUF4238 domain-containing protein [Arenimonas sp.]
MSHCQFGRDLISYLPEEFMEVQTPERQSELHRRNHYVPCMYLKQWATNGHISTYRTLVSDSRVPVWKQSSLQGIAYHEHLYTHVVAGEETDQIERWLDQEFESPATEAIHNANTGARLSKTDWRHLIRFVASQDVRTPARLMENLKRWNETVPALVDATLRNSLRNLESASNAERSRPMAEPCWKDHVPMRVSITKNADNDEGVVKVETTIGRVMWLFSIKHLLTKTLETLNLNRWMLLTPPDDTTWFTSDDPVIRLNYYRDGDYDFNGGWANPGTEIMLPLGPRCLLYTKVGNRPAHRSAVVSWQLAYKFRQIIAEHAHRMIFSAAPSIEVPMLRPRIVNADQVLKERSQWKNWHANQSKAEV